MKENKRKRRKKWKQTIIIKSLLICIILLTILLANKSNKNIKEKTQETFVEVNEPIITKKQEKQKEIDSELTDWNLILVNQENQISENYYFELENIENGHKVDKRIQEKTKQMLEAARREGVKPFICSSYRSNNTQKALFNKKVNQYKKNQYTKEDAKKEASRWVAPPGTSEHEIGLAIDIVSKDYQILDEKQEKTEVQKWLIENCNKYGFVLRYPTNKKEITKVNYEPWHYRYVGVENAKFMKEKDFCLEEYIEYLKRK